MIKKSSLVALVLAAASFSHGATTAYITWDNTADTDKWTVAGLNPAGATDLPMFGENAQVTVTAQFNAGGAFAIGGAGTAWNAGLPEDAMMNGQVTESFASVYTRDGSITVAFTGLDNGVYNLSSLMARGNNNVANMLVSVTAGGVEYGNNASYATNTGTAASTPGNWTPMTEGQPAFSATTNAGALYMDLTNIQVTDGTLTLTINGTRDGNANNAALTWIALQQVPEPATCALSLLGFGTLLLRRRRS
ncbi:PEP-CTERM sorting domain-containing protein [Akkermansia sp.]|uniref:PEP-CTERM sorting domain-containing protein n=1 Tax=Akkermansia sp. TaxID=1872421 RepID=UPI0025C338BA|nr:PEP-CTERM sorting domain-containing protein [Akkermansia sp.]MCD8065033.1 PEP-CTERM sorting domain-containing protein [Akkermansia sp.]